MSSKPQKGHRQGGRPTDPFLSLPKFRSDLVDLRPAGGYFQIIGDEDAVSKVEEMLANGRVPDNLRRVDKGIRAEFNLMWWPVVTYSGPLGAAYMLSGERAPSDARSAIVVKAWSPTMSERRARANGNFRWGDFTRLGASKSGAVPALVRTLIQQNVLTDALRAREALAGNFSPVASWDKAEHVLKLDGIGPLGSVLQVRTDQPLPAVLRPFKSAVLTLAQETRVLAKDLAVMGLKATTETAAENEAAQPSQDDALPVGSRVRHGRNLSVAWRELGFERNKVLLVAPDMLLYGSPEYIGAAILLRDELNSATANASVPSPDETLQHLVLRFFFGWELHVWGPASSMKALIDTGVLPESETTESVRPRLTFAADPAVTANPAVGFELNCTPGQLLSFIHEAEQAFSPNPLEYAGVQFIYDAKRGRVFFKVGGRFVPGSAKSVFEELPEGQIREIYSVLAAFAGVPRRYLDRMRPASPSSEENGRKVAATSTDDRVAA